MILEKIVESTRERVKKAKEALSPAQIKKMAVKIHLEETTENNFPFEQALKGKEIRLICEVKKASPSKGIIAEDFPYVTIAKEYEEAGAACISVLTEPEYFLGKNEYLMEISKNVSLPLLRKDFTVDEYQIYEAKTIGASAVLLICSLLDMNTLEKYIQVAHELGLSALVEAHDEEEVKMAVAAGARIIGVNNRNLNDFTVDINNSLRLRKGVPEDILFVAESGIQSKEDIQHLREGKVDAVLIGEAFMRSVDKRKMLQKLLG